MDNRFKTFLSCIAIIFIYFVSYAEKNSRQTVSPRQMAGKYFSYPYLLQNPPVQTPPPAGFEPFHIEHYGRHGSRWHVGYKYFDQAYDILNKARNEGQLTPLGEKTYQIIKNMRAMAHEGRSGELTEIGARQHKAIGRRMVENFPQVFIDSTFVNARSTVVIRAILSMHNSLDAIRSLCPDISISSDASASDMWYLYYQDAEAKKIRKDMKNTTLKEYNTKHSNGGQYLSRIIKDSTYSNDNIGEKLFTPLFYALANSQSHPNQPWLLDSVFSTSEIYEQWLIGNADWFIEGGNSKLTNNRMPFSQANLLHNIISSADSTLTSHAKSVNLRYGHDSALLPLVVLMEVNEYGKEWNNLEEISTNGWHDYLIVPMAANLQIIFYRNSTNDDILVKVLLNEEEVKLPTGHIVGPYYNWNLLRDYYIKKIEPFITEPHLQKEIKGM